MIIYTNVQALRTINNIERMQKSNSKVVEKLSSGLSINRAADDSAGTAISEKMRAQIRALFQADRNIQDAESLLNITESGLGNVTELIQRMRELAIQSMNDTLSDSDRQAINEEFRQLQLAIDSTSQQSQWSDNYAIDAHSPAFNKIIGNNVFPPDKTIHIISGYNDDLEVVVDGISRSVTIPEGEYESVDILIDVLDDLLIDVDPNLIAHVTEERTISIQAENSQSIDYIKGGASFLLYDYIPGTPPGMIIGATEFDENGYIKTIENVSDKLTFYVGSDRTYEIVFPEGEYTRDEAIDFINKILAKKGETDVKAIAYGDQRIALTSNKYVITGIGGNMIEIDNITSVLYDNRKSGSITKTQAVVTGYKNLTDGVEMIKGRNDELDIYIENQLVEVSFLDDKESSKHLTATEITEKINKTFEDNGVRARASISSGRLEIKSDYYGSRSQVIIDTVSNAFDDLFVRHVTNYDTIKPDNGKYASYQGYYGIERLTSITEDNNVLTGSIGGKTFSIELETKKYTKEELIEALNKHATDLPIEFSLSSTTSDGRSAVVVTNKRSNESFTLNAGSSLFPTLMKGIKIEQPVIKKGETIEHRPPEGIAAPPEYEYKPAVATGSSSLVGLEITNENNKMTFMLNGERKEVRLINGTYHSAEEFVRKHKAVFKNAGVIASYNDSNALVLETKEGGKDQTLNSFGGSSHEYIMGKRIETVPSNITATASYSTVNGVYEIPNDYTIDESNNQLSFTHTHEGKSYDLSIKLDAATYALPAELARNLNQKISIALESYDLPTNAISVRVDRLGRLSLRAESSGEEYSFSNLNGNLFKNLFQKREITQTPLASRTGRTTTDDIYIVGRDIIKDKEFIIHSEVNDLLLFDFKHNQITSTIEIKLDAGKYTHETLIQALNEGLERELEKHGFFPDLIKAQMGGIESETSVEDEDKLVFKVNMLDNGRNDAGSYVIDRIRGTAAYTFFYPSQGDPEPTYTIGVTDLSNGAVIMEGENDTFIFDVDHVEKKIVLPPGEYTSETLLNQLNIELEQANTNVVASYDDGHLKLSSTEVGQISIDGIRGNARGTLFYKTDSRSADKEWTFQIGANSGDHVTVEKVRTSAKLLRINTITVDDPVRAEKALDRLDNALEEVNQERSRIGAHVNRLNHTAKNVRQTAENLVRSESLIRDANIAEEIMEKVKIDILLMANQHALIYTNQNSERVLELLRA